MEVSTQLTSKAHKPPTLFYISKNWQGKSLIDIETAINLIGSKTTETRLKVICQRDDTTYELAKTVSDEDFESISINRIAPFESWNYSFKLE